MPESMISSLKNPDNLIAFFQREFPDFISLSGQEKLVADFFRNPKSSLMSIKVRHLYHETNVSVLRTITRTRL
jgi:kynurenine 3-monooxygenase